MPFIKMFFGATCTKHKVTNIRSSVWGSTSWLFGVSPDRHNLRYSWGKNMHHLKILTVELMSLTDIHGVQ